MQPEAVKRPVVQYFGGKWRLAKWIVSHLPQHDIYTEVFGGGGSVLLRKPRAQSEVYNDLLDDMVIVFTVLRDPAMSKALRRSLRLTPYSRSENMRCKYAYMRGDTPTLTADTDTLVEHARRMLYLASSGVGGLMGTERTKQGNNFRVGSLRSANKYAREWVNYVGALRAIARRVRGVTIEHAPAISILQRYDSSTTTHYVDPPYVQGTRTGLQYVHDFTKRDHIELAECLHNLRGAVVLSGYASKLYDHRLFKNWYRVERETVTMRANTANRRVSEVLWLNHRAHRKLNL